jgi:hypothetical protein
MADPDPDVAWIAAIERLRAKFNDEHHQEVDPDE